MINTSLADTAIQHTQRWLERAVIGLNLCPFAKGVHIKGQVHYAVSAATTVQEILAELEKEVLALLALDASVRDTTLLIVLGCLADFYDYNDFLSDADALLVRLGLDGEFQIASMHPRYQFAGTQVEDITNFTNRSPYPTLHVLRESSIDRAVAAFPNASAIYETNMRTMQDLGKDGWLRLDVGTNLSVT